MNNELPSVYANKINKNINNSQEIFYEKKYINHDDIDIEKKIKDIFASSNFVYKKDVKIIIDNDMIKTTIIGISNGNLLTMDNRSIDIKKIKNIEILN